MKASRILFGICLILTLMNSGVNRIASDIPNTGNDAFYFMPILESVKSNSSLLSIDDFASSITDGDSGSIRGIYASDVFALRVIQQPSNQPNFVSTIEGVATQFKDAYKYGSIGLLSHNFLSGKLFYQLKIGDMIQLIYGDGSVKKYSVESIHQFQALQPENPRSTFVDLTNGAKLSSTNLFLKMYAGQGRLVLQTCIQNGDELSWGRYFVISKPIT